MLSSSGVVSRFSSLKAVVVGDTALDEYLIGTPSRISREAPVLILSLSESFSCPGGATNTAHNLRMLGARTAVVGVVGDDDAGRRLRSLLEQGGIDTANLLVDPNRPTSTATRVVARGAQEVQQQVVRIDRIETGARDPHLRDRMIDCALKALEEADALVLSDYEHGVMSRELIEACLPHARARRLVVTVDAHGDLTRFKGVTLATPNEPEAAATLHRSLDTVEALDEAGRELLAGMDAQAVLITRGRDGMALYEREQPPYHLPVALSSDSHVVDATGAGDTVAAVFTLAVTAGADARMAARISNVAGGMVVRRLGAAAVTAEELSAEITRLRDR